MKKTLHCIVLEDSREKQHGLQNVYHLPWNCGAWFVFSEHTTSGFWMKDTPIPLEIVFLNEHHKVLDIKNLTPHNKEIVHCTSPYKYALELNPGVCESLGVSVGCNLNDYVDLNFIENTL